MDKVTIYLDGVPGAKQRPQFARVAGGVRTFSRAKTVNYETRLADAGRKAWPLPPAQCPIRLTVVAVFPIAKSWPKWQRALAAVGKLWHVGRPDLDNIEKIAMDGLNGVIWKDDGQICDLRARKQYGEVTGLWLTIEFLDDTGALADHTGASDDVGSEGQGGQSPLSARSINTPEDV